MDRLESMLAFVAVAEHRSFSTAARELGLSPSAVTRLVASLEAHLTIDLLHRTTRKVSLTDAGGRYLERARRILAAVEEADADATAQRVEPSGRFVVAAPRIFGRRKVAPVMAEFLRRHPKVTGELSLSDRNVDLFDEGIDVAVRIGALSDSSMVARRVGETRRVVVAAPCYLASRKPPRSPEDLASHTIVQNTAVSLRREWRFVRNKREVIVPISPAFSANCVAASLRVVELGGGVTRALGYQVADAVHEGKLVVLLKRFEPPLVPIHAVYPGSRLPSANVRTFIDLVLDSCNWRFTDFLKPSLPGSLHLTEFLTGAPSLAEGARNRRGCPARPALPRCYPSSKHPRFPARHTRFHRP